MLFSELITYFEKLESTSSRLELIEILAGLFKKVPKQEVDKVIYLLQGRVAPFYAPIEFGMADKMVASSLALAYGQEKDEVWKMYQKAGDMGLVAAQLRGKGKAGRGKLTVDELFERLTEITRTGGEGSVERKVGQLKDLLEHADAVEAKHLVRIPLGNNRLGIGDPTVLDGLATAILGDKTKRKLLEKAYNETSDMGLIGKTLVTHGLEAVQKLGVTIGRPIRSELCERLPNPMKVFEKMNTNGQGIHSTPKYDGFRVQIHKDGDKISMFSRNLENMTNMFPELTQGALKQIKAKTIILDSEALAYQPDSEEFLPFQETTKRRRKHNIEEVAKTLPLKAFVFDILYINGKSLMDTPLLERMAMLKEALHGDETLIPAPGRILHKPEELQTMLDDSISKGLEGVVVKRVDSLYEAGGRNFNWIKLKRHSSGELHDTIDCVILGYIFGKGKRTAFGAGALLVGVYDKERDMFVSVSRIGTGLSDEEWQSIKTKTHGLELSHKPARVDSLITPSVWVRPQIVIEVLADEITRSPMHTAGADFAKHRSPALPAGRSPASRQLTAKTGVEGGAGIQEKSENMGYALRFPRLVTFRDKDKKPEDATSVKELIEMFEQQGKKE